MLSPRAYVTTDRLAALSTTLSRAKRAERLRLPRPEPADSIVDVPRIPAAPYRHALDIADVRVMVADQTLRAVRDTVRLRDALGDSDPARCNLLVVNRAGEGGRHALTLGEMARVRLSAKFVIPFRPKLFTAPGLARHGPVTEAVASLAAEISGRTSEQNPWWRFAR